MADGAAEITKSLREVFGLYGVNDGETLRQMCWPHTYRNYSKQLAPIKKINKNLAKDIDKLSTTMISRISSGWFKVRRSLRRCTTCWRRSTWAETTARRSSRR